MRSCLIALLGSILATLARAQRPLITEHGTYAVHLLQRTIGTEDYTITDDGKHRQLTVTTDTSDRGMKRTVTTTLDYLPNLTPTHFEQHSITPATATTAAVDNASLTEITANKVTVRESDTSRTFTKPAIAFTGSANMPAAAQMLMMRYWLHHGRPARLPLLRASPDDLPVEIRAVGHDAFTVHGEIIRLTRYTVANLVFGREVLWLNDSERVAAVMTFAGGLPQEEVLDEYKSAFDPLFQSGVSQELLTLAAITRSVRPVASGTFAITGARLIDTRLTTSPANIENATVLVRKGIIAAVGPADSVRVPPGTRVLRANGQSVLPGLWQMRVHYSGVEFGPALLASGVTTARDCGGEFRFLLAVRHAIADQHQLGPRLLLAGLVDGAGRVSPNGETAAFGLFTAATPSEGMGAVDMYADARFDQIMAYTHIQPDVLSAIADEAAKRGLTVIDALSDADAPAVSTNDTDLPGYGLHRELELRLQTGMTPLQAIQSATIVPATVMHHDADSGTIEPGKRADLILVPGDPLTDISALRHVTTVIAEGRAYSTKSLAQAVGFRR
jgi:imidazolonepropionase-like amidohydrolase